MVIGNGMMARRFMDHYKDDSKVIIFASGVSNSNEVSDDQYLREKMILKECLRDHSNKKLVYFSSVIHLSGMKTKYLDHKRDVEKLLQDHAENYLILRLPQVVGRGGNKNNIVNYFDECVKKNVAITVQENTYRSLVDIDDVFEITKRCIDLDQNATLNLSYIEKIRVDDLASLVFEINNHPKNLTYHPSGYSILTNNSSIVDTIIDELNIDKYNYTKRVLSKYIIV